MDNNKPNPDPQPYKSVLAKYMTLAMQNGLKLGGLFALQAVSMLLYKFGIISSLLFLGAFIAVPIYLVILGNQFRDNQLGGQIRYTQAVGYLSWSYLFSLIVAAIVFFVAFTILFNDVYFLNMMEENIITLENILADTPNGDEMMASIRNLTPRSVTIQTIVSALFFGVIYIYIVGIFIKRTNK